jgi:hypothetical protein
LFPEIFHKRHPFTLVAHSQCASTARTGVLDTFEEENQGETAQHHQPEHAEDVHKRPQVRLPVERIL